MLPGPRCFEGVFFSSYMELQPRILRFLGMLLQAHDWVPNEESWPFGERLCLAHCWQKCKELSELCCLQWGPADLPH